MKIEEAKRKYNQHLNVIRELKEKLEAIGCDINVEDDNELEATYIVLFLNKKIARVWWNVPYYLEFEPYVPLTEEKFTIDYVKNIEDWQKFISDIAQTIFIYVSTTKGASE